MSTRKHFRTDPASAALFDQIVERDPARAVRMMLSRDLTVEEGDIETPTLQALESCPREVRSEFALKNAGQIGRERQALQLVRGQVGIFRQQESERTTRAQEERELQIRKRAAELEAADHADRMARFRAIAEAELTGTSDSQTTTTTTRKTRKSA